MRLTMKTFAYLITAAICFSSLSSCGKKTEKTGQTEQAMKIGVVTVGPVSDGGYNFAHNQGQEYLKAHLPGVQTTVVENIPESAEVERVMEKLIAKGNKLIFSTSYGYLEPAQRVAERHPEVTFIQSGRKAKTDNLSSFFAYQYEPFYIVGTVAGKMTKTNKIGLVCAHPVPILLQMINAFTLGARSVNPKVTVKVVWTNKWSDPATEAEASKGLIDMGVDVLGCIVDSPITVTQTGESNKVMVVGSQADLREYAPVQWLTGSRWNWGPLYLRIGQDVKNGSWKSAAYWYRMKDDAVDLSSFGKLVPEQTKNDALDLKERIKSGDFVIFKGPIKDRQGKVQLPAGEEATEEWLTEMNFFVPGVEGTLPKH